MIKRLFATNIKYPISVTSGAWSKMTSIIERQGKDIFGFVFSASSGGCNGFNYNLKLLNKEDYNTDYHKYSKRLSVMEENNTKLVIDPLSEMYLIGTTIDYINEDFEKGVFENKFIFLADKNMATSCGCGTSFTPKN